MSEAHWTKKPLGRPTSNHGRQEQEHLIIPPNALVFYVDDLGDERLSDVNHPIFAFGGVGCVFEFHGPVAELMACNEAPGLPLVTGRLHAATHMREGRLGEAKRANVLAAMAHCQLGRVGTLVTNKRSLSLTTLSRSPV